MKRYTFLLGGLMGIIIILSVVQISVSNMLSTGGISLSKMQEEIANYQRDNAMLREKIYTQASLTNISHKADKLGFVQEDKKTTALVITDHTSSVALRQ